jgi:hypothetical protein
MESLDSIVMSFESLPMEDTETAHMEADALLMHALILLGGERVVDAFNRAAARHGGFWYA